MRARLRTLIIAMLALVVSLPAATVQSREARTVTASLDNVSVAVEDGSTVVRVKTSGPRRYRADLLDKPYRLVLDFEDTTYAWRRTPMAAFSGPLVQIRGSQYRKGTARVVLEIAPHALYSIREERDTVVVVLGAPLAPTDAHVTPLTAASRTSAAPSVPITLGREVSGQSPTDSAPAASTPAPATVSDVAQAIPTAQATPPATAAPLPPSPLVMPPSPAVPVVPPPPAEPPAAVASVATPATTAPESRLISLEFKDAEVVNLLRILAAESGSNIVIGDDVKGKMSISLRNVPWTLALQTIMETRGLERVDRDGVIRIVSIDQLMKDREARARMAEAKVKAEVEIRTKKAEAELKEQEVQHRKRAAEAAAAEALARGPLVEEAVRLSYADPGDIANTLQGLLGLEKFAEVKPCRSDEGEGTVLRTAAIRGPIAEPPFSQLFGPPPPPEVQIRPSPSTPSSFGITVHCATNTLFLRMHATDLERMKKMIRESLDVPAPQVKIEARMEILERDDLFAIGVQWGGGGVLAVDSNKNAIVGRGFTSDFSNLPIGGIPPVGLGTLSNPNLELGQAIPVSSQTGLPLGGNLINLPIGALLQGAVPAGAGGIALGIIGSRLNLNLILEAMRAQGKTFTLARPDIVTLENRKAKISLGEEIPYATVSSAGTQVQFKLAVLQLVVTPTVVRVGNRNRIKMTVLVENNSRGSVVNLGASGSPPAINRRRAETEVLINDGDHLVIGGVTTSVQREDIRKVPLFGDVPVLGWLFKQRGTLENRRELVVFITPSVIKSDGPAAASLSRPAMAGPPAK